MIKRQIRIHMNGVFQFAVTTTAEPEALVRQAADTMKINVRSVDVSPGVINLLTH